MAESTFLDVWRVDLRRIPDGKPPRFPKKPTIRQEGDLLIMECILEAHPVPDITWYQGQKTIADSKRVKMLRKATGKDTYLLTLEISNPTKADGGNYRCNAFNNFGESNANISLNFQGKSPRSAREGSHHDVPTLVNFISSIKRFFMSNRSRITECLITISEISFEIRQLDIFSIFHIYSFCRSNNRS